MNKNFSRLAWLLILAVVAVLVGHCLSRKMQTQNGSRHRFPRWFKNNCQILRSSKSLWKRIQCYKRSDTPTIASESELALKLAQSCSREEQLQARISELEDTGLYFWLPLSLLVVIPWIAWAIAKYRRGPAEYLSSKQ